MEAKGRRTEDLDKLAEDVEVLPEEVRRARREIMDYVLGMLMRVAGYWHFVYRNMLLVGLGITADSRFDVGEEEDGLAVMYVIRVIVPKEIFVKYAKYRKRKLVKLPKPHPLVRQRYRRMEEGAEEVLDGFKKEITRLAEEVERVIEGGEEGSGGGA